jgi:hypothetical protein
MDHNHPRAGYKPPVSLSGSRNNRPIILSESEERKLHSHLETFVAHAKEKIRISAIRSLFRSEHVCLFLVVFHINIYV